MEEQLIESRGQKRSEMLEQLPADKRACSSLEFRPSSSNAIPQPFVNSGGGRLGLGGSGTHEGGLETSSSSAASVSGRSEGDDGERDRDSPYNSCDSDGMNDDDDDDDGGDGGGGGGGYRYSSLRAFQRSRSYGDTAKYSRVVSSLSNEAEPSGQLAGLTELCELLSFCAEDSVSSSLADQLAPLLVKLAKHESNPDIMLLAIRALTYLCDAFPRSSGSLVKHDAVPALCQRLMVIEYLDVAEQCLQALEKISRYQPLACLQSGAIMAVLGYIDFFSTTVQRTALSVVVNICKKLPSECPSPFMEAVPALCNLLQYEDQQLVELVANCLIKIVDRVKDSSEMLSQLYGHGLIHQATHLIGLNSRITLSQPTYTGLIGLIAKLASGSTDAVRSLFELDIGSILKEVLCNSSVSHGIPSPRSVDKIHNQVHEILKLLHELLPEVARDDKDELLSRKERILLDHPDRLQKFGMDILPTLVQVVSSGASSFVCYGCLSVINRVLYFSKVDSLHELIKSINIASFLAGVFTHNDHHILLLALQIAETVMEKLSNVLVRSFIKEGVLFSIDALLTPDGSPQLTLPVIDGNQTASSSGKDIMMCLCYAYGMRQSGSTSQSETCKVDRSSVQNLAQHIKTKYFPEELNNAQSAVTDVLQDLRNVSAALTGLLNSSPGSDIGAQKEEKLCNVLDKVMLQLSGREPISTFELIESGVIKALLEYLANGQYLSSSDNPYSLTHGYGVQKRFETFASILLSSPDPVSSDLPLSLLVRILQSALSALETFPVIGGYAPRQRGCYATVPSGRCTMYPCLRVRFVQGEEESRLSDYSVDAVSVDPFCQVEDIERYLRVKVGLKKMKSSEPRVQSSGEVGTPQTQASISAASLSDKSLELAGSGRVDTVSPDSQEDMGGRSQCSPMDTSSLEQTTIGDSKAGPSDGKIHSPEANANLKSGSAQTADNATSSQQPSVDEEFMEKSQCQASCSIDDVPPKLALYLEGEQLDYASALYQEILQRRIKSQHDLNNAAKLWSDMYTITYKKAAGTETRSYSEGSHLCDGNASDKPVFCQQVIPPICQIFIQKLGSSLDPSSPTFDILSLLRSLEMMNKFTFHLLSNERTSAFAEGKLDNLDQLKVRAPTLPQHEFVNSKLTEKLEQQMREPAAVHIGAMPLWCSQLMACCPFLFSFEARWKYFQLAALGRSHIQSNLSTRNDSDVPRERRSSTSSLPRKKFLVCRDRILESASQLMDLYARKKVVVEVEYTEEVGTGLGPTLEFYTLLSHEFQKAGLGMWRGDYISTTNGYNQHASTSGFLISTSGLFPRPWSPTSSNISGIEFSDVLKKFILLGQTVGKAIQDGRVLDIPFSKAFYKLVLGKELFLCDIESFDPELGRTLLEFQALANRQKCLQLTCRDDIASGLTPGFRCTKIEDLCLDFILPGYPDYILASGMDNLMVNTKNLEDYISLVSDATLRTGIARQVEAFKSGLNQVIPDKHLHLFTEEELERLLCGERDSWVSCDLLDHIKFDHGYTAGSPPVMNLLEVISELNYEQRRAFLQFVTGAPRLPPGGLSALNPKLTIVRKHSSHETDADLPSVMTCANYLKLPPYSSKEKLKEKLMYAITEGQGSFHLS